MMDALRLQEMAMAEADEQDLMKEQPKKLIYIAGKLNSDACGYIKNVHAMVKHAEKVRKLGCSVAVPCLDLIHGLICGDHGYSDYFENNIEIMKRCDAVALVPNWKTSEGAKKEIKVAHDLNMPILYDLKEVKQFLGV
jgi:hypothetical protein